MTKRLAVIALFLSTLLLAGVYAAVLLSGRTPAWAPWLAVVAIATLSVATIVLGAVRSGGGVGRLALPLAFVYFLLLACFGAALALPADLDAAEPLWLGLPRRAAILLYGIGVLPLFVLPIAYALTFDSVTLRQHDLDRVASARRAREAAAAGDQ